MRYRFLARKLHSDKNNTDVTEIMVAEAVELFKLVNNA